MAEDEEITVSSTSAGYIATLMNSSGLKTKEKFDLTGLRALLSTGSSLFIEGFDFVNDEIKKDIQLASISGGTYITAASPWAIPWGLCV